MHMRGKRLKEVVSYVGQVGDAGDGQVGRGKVVRDDGVDRELDRGRGPRGQKRPTNHHEALDGQKVLW
jgi:hypothetical protein